MQRLIYTTLLIAAIWAHPSHADPLQQRIESAIEAFGGIIPHAPDVGLGWADMVIRGAVEQSNPSAVISSDKIGDWLIANPPKDADAALLGHVDWVAKTFKTVMGVNTKFATAHPAEQISVSDLNLRIVAAVDKVTPGPSREELRLIEEAAIQRSKESDEEYRNRRWPQE